MAVIGQQVLTFDTGIEQVVDPGFAKARENSSTVARKTTVSGRDFNTSITAQNPDSLEKLLLQSLAPSADSSIIVDQAHFNGLFDANMQFLQN